MGRFKGHISPAKAARMLGVHRNTVYTWARKAVKGEESKLSDVKRHTVTGYLSIPLEEVHRLRSEAGGEEGES